MLEGKSRGIKNVTLVSAGKVRFARGVLITVKVYPIKQNFRGFPCMEVF
jgi:hypothetical protein